MKYTLTSFLFALGLSASHAVTLNLGALTGTFPTYSDPTTGITITYLEGNIEAGSEQNGFSLDATNAPDGNRGMALPPNDFPDGHLAVGANDRISVNFGATDPGPVDFVFYDIDDAFGASGDESAIVIGAGDPVVVEGSATGIPNDNSPAPNLIVDARQLPEFAFGIQPVEVNGEYSIEVQGGPAGPEGIGFFAFSVGVPEPSSALLALSGFALIGLRRRRS